MKIPVLYKRKLLTQEKILIWALWWCHWRNNSLLLFGRRTNTHTKNHPNHIYEKTIELCIKYTKIIYVLSQFCGHLRYLMFHISAVQKVSFIIRKTIACFMNNKSRRQLKSRLFVWHAPPRFDYDLTSRSINCEKRTQWQRNNFGQMAQIHRIVSNFQKHSSISDKYIPFSI